MHEKYIKGQYEQIYTFIDGKKEFCVQIGKPE